MIPPQKGHTMDRPEGMLGEARDADLNDLLRETIEHLHAARRAHMSDPLVNVALAEAIADVIRHPLPR